MLCKHDNVGRFLRQENLDIYWECDKCDQKFIPKEPDKLCKKCWDKGLGCASCESPDCPSNKNFCKCHKEPEEYGKIRKVVKKAEEQFMQKIGDDLTKMIEPEEKCGCEGTTGYCTRHGKGASPVSAYVTDCKPPEPEQITEGCQHWDLRKIDNAYYTCAICRANFETKFDGYSEPPNPREEPDGKCKMYGWGPMWMWGGGYAKVQPSDQFYAKIEVLEKLLVTDKILQAHVADDRNFRTELLNYLNDYIDHKAIEDLRYRFL